jgi:hypothetical protein
VEERGRGSSGLCEKARGPEGSGGGEEGVAQGLVTGVRGPGTRKEEGTACSFLRGQ